MVMIESYYPFYVFHTHCGLFDTHWPLRLPTFTHLSQILSFDELKCESVSELSSEMVCCDNHLLD